MRRCWWLLGVLVGCGESHADDARDDVAVVAPRVAHPAPLRPLPGQRRGAWATALNAQCAACHGGEAAAWHASRHRTSNTNLAYQAAFTREPAAFCTSCHAPEAADLDSPTAAESALGVGCVSCHVVGTEDDYAVLATESASRHAPHRVIPSNDFAGAGACANCHQFHFPGLAGNAPEAFMQTTVSELAEAAGADASCAPCHLPNVDGRRDHGFAQVRDPRWLAARLDATASFTEHGDVAVTLSQPQPSHAFPTGDLFRRLEVGVSWRDAHGKVLAEKTAYLARHFVFLPGQGMGRTLTHDNRVRGHAEVLLEREGGAPATTARWWVTLQRVSTVGTGEHPEEAHIESEQPLHGAVIEQRR